MSNAVMSNAVERWNKPGAVEEAQKRVDQKVSQAVTAPEAQINKTIRAVKTPKEISDDIKKFEASDFTDADLPAWEYYASVATDDNFEAVLMALEAKASEKKVTKKAFQKGLEIIGKKYKLPQAEKEEPEASGITGLDEFFDDEVTFGRFIANDKGITTTISGIEVCVCMNPVVISERRENINSGEESIEIAFRLPVETKWRKVVVPTEKAFTKAGIVKALTSRGCDVTEDSARDLIAYLRYFKANNLSKIKKVDVSEKLGWMDDKKFVPFTSDIKFDSARAGVNAEIGESLRASGDPDLWLNAIRKFRALKTSLPSRIMMAGSAAAPVVGLLKVLPFWVHMTGNGTTGKSVTMRMCATMWGYAPLNGGWMQTMNTTVNSLEDLANFSNNLPLCLNELQLLQRKDPRAFAEFVYRMCEGNGRRRLGRDAQQKKAGAWFTTTLSCGEDHVVTEMDRGGALSRVIDLNIDEPVMPVTELKPFCVNYLDKSYGHAGKVIIDAIAAMEPDTIRQEIADITDNLSKYGKATKQVDSAAILLWADRLMERVLFKDGITISDTEMLGYLKAEEEINDDRKAFDAIKSIISENINNFSVQKPVMDFNGKQKLDKYGNPIFETEAPRGRCWGKIEDDGATVMLDARVFNTEIMANGYDPVRTIKYCLKNGYVEDGHTDNHTSATKQKRFTVGGPKTWCYVFHFKDEFTPVPTKPKEPEPVELPF